MDHIRRASRQFEILHGLCLSCSPRAAWARSSDANQLQNSTNLGQVGLRKVISTHAYLVFDVVERIG